MCELLGQVLRKHIKLLMSLFRKQLGEYVMRPDDDTKCLNTAVTLMYSYLGDEALSHTHHCNVDRVRKRSRMDGNDSAYQVSLLRSLLSNKAESKTLYYVMITDTMGHGDDFPGHAFIIEKLSQDRFRIYQSYIRKYTLGQVPPKGSGVLTHAEIDGLMEGLQHLYTGGIWDEHVRKCWRHYIHVDTPDMLGVNIKDRVLFCFRRVTMQACGQSLLVQLRRHLFQEKLDAHQVTQIKQVISDINTTIKRNRH